METEIINKVAQSSLVSIDLELWFPQGTRMLFDLKPLLFQELMLKEKDFRAFLKSHDWVQYQDAYVAIDCTADAIVPTWAFMLVALHLEPFAKTISFGNLTQLEDQVWKEAIDTQDLSIYQDAKVVIKGCSKIEVPIAAYVHLSSKLRSICSSIMYGEPCSTVPLYKQKVG